MRVRNNNSNTAVLYTVSPSSKKGNLGYVTMSYLIEPAHYYIRGLNRIPGVCRRELVSGVWCFIVPSGHRPKRYLPLLHDTYAPAGTPRRPPSKASGRTPRSRQTDVTNEFLSSHKTIRRCRRASHTPMHDCFRLVS